MKERYYTYTVCVRVYIIVESLLYSSSTRVMELYKTRFHTAIMCVFQNVIVILNRTFSFSFTTLFRGNLLSALNLSVLDEEYHWRPILSQCVLGRSNDTWPQLTFNM